MENLKSKLKTYIKKNIVHENFVQDMFINNMYAKKRCSVNYENINACFEQSKAHKQENTNIKDFIDNHEQFSDFQTMLFKLIDDRNLKDSDVYNKVHIDRRLFSKIRSDKNYHPSKETILLLAIALNLSEEELDNLLDSASYSLPKNNNYDLIIRFCFINKIFNISDINELLYEYNCKLFNY